MLDGILGRGFSSKCKSSIKPINSRIDLIKKKKSAMVRYLKKDVADLLTRGQDINAFKKVEALIMEMNLSWGYEMIEQYCGCILNQLPCIQKQRDCPPEATEAVAGLMFAAARFADLPELRNLRALFTDRYGDALATSATDLHSNCSTLNQEFVEKVSSKSPSVDMKLQLMREISKEFSINWDSKAFEQKISTQNASLRDNSQKRGSFKNSNENAHHYIQNDVRGQKVIEVDNQQIPSHRRQEPTLGYARQQEVDRRDIPSTTSSYTRYPHDTGGGDAIEREINMENSTHRRPEPTLGYTRKKETVENRDNPNIKDTGNDYPLDPVDKKEWTSRETVNMKPKPSQNIMPPYVKPRSGHKNESTSKAGSDPSSNERLVGSGPRSLEEHSTDAREITDNTLVGDSKPKPKSVRRRPLKPPVNRGGDEVNDNETPRTAPKTRTTRDPRQSFRPINDNGDVDRDDGDDAIMDELLIHYSRKPTYEDKISAGTTNGKRDKSHSHPDPSVPPNRTLSLPTEQMNSPKELPKGHIRASSMQPDIFNPSAGHVHPKLPDYDDLAARIAALRKGM